MDDEDGEFLSLFFEIEVFKMTHYNGDVVNAVEWDDIKPLLRRLADLEINSITDKEDNL